MQPDDGQGAHRSPVEALTVLADLRRVHEGHHTVCSCVGNTMLGVMHRQEPCRPHPPTPGPFIIIEAKRGVS